MNRTASTALALTLAACASQSAPQSPSPEGDPVQAEARSAIAKVYPALVRIHVVSLEYSGGREDRVEAAGSGAIISADGYVVTNHHVAARANLITCTLSTREEIPATLVGTDALADIAVLKLRLDERRYPQAPVSVAAFGDSDALRVGDRVLAMGCPGALSQSVTQGIVSNTSLVLPERFMGRFELDGENVGSLVTWIGHDAQIFHGNSGGPLVDMNGRIVGINELGIGLSGAIPSNVAMRVATEIIAHGSVTRSYVGIRLQPLLRGSKEDRGALVADVVAGSPAARAGLRSGDVLVSYDAAPVTARFEEEIPAINRRILETPVGRVVPVVVLRDGTEIRADVTTEVRGKAQGDDREFKAWGMTSSDITALQGIELRRGPRSGAYVTSMKDGGPASQAKPPIEAGDVITEIGGSRIEEPADVERITKAIVAGKDEPVPTLVAIERRSERILTVVKVGPSPEDRSLEAKKAWFPAACQVLTDPLAEALGLKGKTGVRVTQIYPGAAEKAGLREGDVIVALDGDPIPAEQPEDMQVFPHMIRQHKIGSKAELTVFRDGKETKFEIELPVRPKEGRELASYKDDVFEFTVHEISFNERIENRWAEDEKGAVVGAVESGGWAGFAGLSQGDLLVAVDGRPVAGVDDVKAAMADVENRKPEQVALQVKRGIHWRFVEIRPAWPASR